MVGSLRARERKGCGIGIGLTVRFRASVTYDSRYSSILKLSWNPSQSLGKEVIGAREGDAEATMARTLGVHVGASWRICEANGWPLEVELLCVGGSRVQLGVRHGFGSEMR